MKNKNTQGVSMETLAAIEECLNHIREKIPFLKQLSDDERLHLLPMTEQNKTLVQKSLHFMQAFPDNTPHYINHEMLRLDFELAQNLNKIIYELESLTQIIKDTALVASSSALASALCYYGNICEDEERNLPNADIITFNMSQYFPGKEHTKHKKTEALV